MLVSSVRFHPPTITMIYLLLTILFVIGNNDRDLDYEI